MAIYNIFDYYESDEEKQEVKGPKIDPDAFVSGGINETHVPAIISLRDRILSAIGARFFFFLLLIADVVWCIYSLARVLMKSLICLLTFCKIPQLKKSLLKSWTSLKRSLVSGLALIVALFSPALGIMFSCMYFLMYDRDGVDEIVPASLKEQFRALFPDSVF